MNVVVRAVQGILAAALVLASIVPGAAQSPPAGELDRHIAVAQRLLQRRPLDPRGYLRLGDAFIQKARASGDASYFDRAETVLRRGLELHPDYGDAHRNLAFVLYARHDFGSAERHAARAVALNPRDPHARGVLGDAQLEVGRYDEAARTYEAMMTLGADLFSYSRRAGLRSVRGDTRGAIDDLVRAIADGRARRLARESIAWAQWQLGNEHLAIGDIRAAESAYTEALTTYPGYYRAAAGLAQVRVAQRRYEEAVGLYQQSLAVVPMPEYAAALGSLFAHLKRPEEAAKQFALVEYIGYLNAANQAIYNRELAYFYADHDLKLDHALLLARRELEVRRDIYAHDVLAWALHKNGRHAEALAPMTEAMRLGTRDAKLFYHAGMIYAALGRADLARTHLQRALALNPHFDLRQAPLAEAALRDLRRPPR